ncbi:vWA domain-containing protein [Schlesneria paludicola]|uniref:vWA domain-containing protein n=1 Tax=Schlesneria paludicola TaxID=360056 RepID=UPI0002D727F5|nr:vWA domain-containing protein [Schlesneria paludicola]
MLSGLAASFVLHAAMLIALSLIVFESHLGPLHTIVDSIFSEDRTVEEFHHEVEPSTETSETVNYVAGALESGGVSIGGSEGPVIAQKQLDEAPSLQQPTVQLNIGEFNVPGLQVISKDLGATQVTGDSGRVVEGYGAALGQMTLELIRMMREQKVLVVWLFDESESMQDDQQEIRERFYKIYEEVGRAQQVDAKLKPSEETLLSSVMSFGKDVHELTPKPTANTEEIKSAIDAIEIDKSGIENMCGSIQAALVKYKDFARRQKRKLVFIVVSDESGDDGNQVEDVIDACKKAKASVYVLGHYSVFGYPIAHVSWIDPKYRLKHWIPVNRGPETPEPECLQFDGLHDRWDVFSSGFGPYEQVRLAKQTGGIFFILPGHEDNLAGYGSHEDRKYDLLGMKEYLPDLDSRQAYIKNRSEHRFREAQWQVVQALNPHRDSKLMMKSHWYSGDPSTFEKEAVRTFEQAVRALMMLNDQVRILDSVKKLRDKESSARWRVNFDLMHAQCLAYRVRLFQLLLSIDQHRKSRPTPKDPRNNCWSIQYVHTLLEPDKEQVKETRVDLEELKKQDAVARNEFESVVRNHPGTPWARRAQWELGQGFGVKFVEDFRSPYYDHITAGQLPKQ